MAGGKQPLLQKHVCAQADTKQAMAGGQKYSKSHTKTKLKSNDLVCKVLLLWLKEEMYPIIGLFT